MAEKIVESVIKKQKEGIVIMYDYRDVSKLLGINANKALKFLKKFGVKIGHWQIERGKLLKVLNDNEGRLI